MQKSVAWSSATWGARRVRKEQLALSLHSRGEDKGCGRWCSSVPTAVRVPGSSSAVPLGPPGLALRQLAADGPAVIFTFPGCLSSALSTHALSDSESALFFFTSAV